MKYSVTKFLKNEVFCDKFLKNEYSVTINFELVILWRCEYINS